MVVLLWQLQCFCYISNLVKFDIWKHLNIPYFMTALLLRQIQGWIDGRNTSYEEDSGSWCHGATGIALSRLILASEGFPTR